MKNIKDVITKLQCELVAERSLVNPDEISWLQYDILFTLSQKKCFLPSQLCLMLGISRVKLAKALKGLKQLEFILQTRSSVDGRELETKITEKGLTLLKTINKGHNDLTNIIKQLMDKNEQQVFCELANRLSSALQQRRLEHEKSDTGY